MRGLSSLSLSFPNRVGVCSLPETRHSPSQMKAQLPESPPCGTPPAHAWGLAVHPRVAAPWLLQDVAGAHLLGLYSSAPTSSLACSRSRMPAAELPLSFLTLALRPGLVSVSMCREPSSEESSLGCEGTEVLVRVEAWEEGGGYCFPSGSETRALSLQ